MRSAGAWTRRGPQRRPAANRYGPIAMQLPKAASTSADPGAMMSGGGLQGCPQRGVRP